MNANQLIDELMEMTKDHLNRAEKLRQLPLEQLNYKPGPDRWSILECMEHVNRYGNFYLPEMERQMQASTYPASDTFRPGWLGNYFAKSMLPREQLNKMNTFKDMNPNGSELDMEVADTFIHQQHRLLDLLTQARQADLTHIKTGITISRWIRLRLGDTLRVVIYHTLRHMEQMERNVNVSD